MKFANSKNLSILAASIDLPISLPISLMITAVLASACAPASQTSFSTSNSASTSSVNSASVSACNLQMQSAVTAINLSQTAFYTGLALAAPIASKQSQFIAGTNGETVVIIHGFDSSPADMANLMVSVNSAGYSVIAPLLTGFGADAAAANKSSITDWRKSVTDAVSIAKSCSSEVSLIGHSLGGALVADQLINQGLKGIASAVLLEPALKTRYPALNVALSLLLVKTDTLSVSTFKTLTGFDPYVYLPILKPAAGEAEPAIPLQAAQNVVDLENVFLVGSPTSSVATLLVISQGDYVIDPTFDAAFSSAHFSNLLTQSYPVSADVNHFVETPASNPQYQDMVSHILSLLAAN